MINDATAVELLRASGAKQLLDCRNLYPNDYTVHRQGCSQDRDALQRQSSGISDFLKIFFYGKLRRAIETNAIEDIRSMAAEIDKMGFALKHLSQNGNQHDYVQCQPYVPLLFLAIERRSLPVVRLLLELGVSKSGRIVRTKSGAVDDISGMADCSITESDECVDLATLIRDLENDALWKDVFQDDDRSVTLVSEITEQSFDTRYTAFSRARELIQKLSRKDPSWDREGSRTCVVL